MLRRAQDPADGGQSLGLQPARGDAIGGDHDVFNQIVGAVVALRYQVAKQFALEHGTGLNGLQGQRAVCMAHSPKRLRHLVLQVHLTLQSGAFEARGRTRA